MLLITLRLAMPSVLRFMVCGFIFYVAFLLLGWLVMGPYHPKVCKYQLPTNVYLSNSCKSCQVLFVIFTLSL